MARKNCCPPLKTGWKAKSPSSSLLAWAALAVALHVGMARFTYGVMLPALKRDLALDYFGAVARFELTPDGRGGTDLLLTQDGVPVAEWDEVHAGWLNVLFPLKAWLAHGVDLRNHDPARSWDRGYADQ